MIELIVEPEKAPAQWKHFRKRALPFSIAIDGYVDDGPKEDLSIPALNLNHHAGCDRYATLATCQQAHMYVRMDLFETFCDAHGEPTALVYCGDCDHDVIMTWYILKNHEQARPTFNPMLNRLVDVVGKLDATAGAYPFPKHLPFVRKVDWIFAPYMDFRASGQIDKKKGHEYRHVIEQVCERIRLHLLGEGEEIKVSRRYDIIGGGTHWKMVNEIGTGARVALFADGIPAFVSVRQRLDGSHTVSICRKSKFITDVDVPAILHDLNEEEGLLHSADQWGGGDTCGGSPRVRGTLLPLSKIAEVMERRISLTLRQKSERIVRRSKNQAPHTTAYITL